MPVQVGSSRQVITVKASGSRATVTAWQKNSSGWKQQLSTNQARVGSNGITNGATRTQGTSTTPTGTYTITEGFGINANPGTKVPYTQVTADHWWVEDPKSAYYNQMRRASEGGFPLTEAGERGSEQIIRHTPAYRYALVIDYNLWPAVPGRGAGIFLHVNGQGATAGGVSVPQATMTQIMRWIDPAAQPRIAIG
ncbi:L,D-transpeptidase family protein [Streptomyces sp. N35]|uniref:L,D-transpeptidase family protein n=1 Tax=Streptomyces sp. N35 TaxID=2795730 RepID=UPI0027DAC49E|nr:L,D-transpeptidase family protein [Streptomyces sp. N35]